MPTSDETSPTAAPSAPSSAAPAVLFAGMSAEQHCGVLSAAAQGPAEPFPTLGEGVGVATARIARESAVRAET